MALNRKAGAWHTQAGPCPDSREQGRGRGDAVSRVVKTQECGQSHTQLHGSEGTGLFLGGAQAGVHSIKPSRALDIADFLGQPYQAITPHFSGMRRGSKQRSTPHSLMVELA